MNKVQTPPPRWWLLIVVLSLRTLSKVSYFGHQKGSFTGAHQEKKGLFEIADQGTLFLDEVGEIPIHLQPKLLRVLQSRTFRRVGGNVDIEVQVRIISATNKDLEKKN